ncbi:MAG TPA: EAL domain-containing protein [Kaistiaceae bacterium]|nr:EAL domain-containing protein [Kaistiaceae bacterium]
MERIAAIVIAVCMVVIAGAFGAVLYRVAGLTIGEAAAVALALILVFVLLEGQKLRERDRRLLEARLEDLNRFSGTLAREVQHLEDRVASIETGATDTAEDRLGGLVTDFARLETRIGRLAEEVGRARDEASEAHAVGVEASRRLDLRPAPVPLAPVAVVEAEEPVTRAPVAERKVGDEPLSDAELVRAVKSAIEDDRIELFLQPIVTLPQRKVRYYEALTRLRGPDGELIRPSEFLPIAEREGILAKLDNLVLFRAVQVLRRLTARNRDLGIFCNLGLATVVDAAMLQEMHGFLEANRALAGQIVLEFSQKTVRAMGPVEIETLGALADLGFRFSVDQVRDLKTDLVDLADRGVRFLKINAGLLLHRSDELRSDIHPADLADLLARHGIELIADHIESETAVVDLLDFDLKFGQGNLFSPAKPVRAEILQGPVPAEPKRVAAR